MAIYPCDYDGRRYPFGQQTVYLHFVEQGTELGGKLRLCPKHMDHFLTDVTPNMLLTQDGEDAVELDEDQAPVCVSCGAEEFRTQIFAHAYAKGLQRRSYWGGVCEACRPAVVQEWTKAV